MVRALLALVLLASTPAVRGGCSMKFELVSDQSPIDITGILSGLIFIEVEGNTPRIQGDVVAAVDGPCPSTPEGWNTANPTLSATDLSLVGDVVRLKAAVVHFHATGTRFTFSPRRGTMGPDGMLNFKPHVSITQGHAKIGNKDLGLNGASGEGNINATFHDDGTGHVALEAEQVFVHFQVMVPEMPDTFLEIKGAMSARERPGSMVETKMPAAAAASSTPRASPPPPPPPVGVPPPGRTLSAGATPACDPPCASHGECVQAEGRRAGVGRCECACNFVGADCSVYAPLRLSLAEPATVPFDEPVRVNITGRHLGELALLPAPLDGPAFSVTLSTGGNCSGIEVLGPDAIACTVPPLRPGDQARFVVKRGCATAPFAPRAAVQAEGCNPPEQMRCAVNQHPTPDGCACACREGWRGEMCTACAADSGCSALLARADDGAVESDGGSSPAGDDDGGLVCRTGDFRLYHGTWQKSLACQLLDLPEGIDPLVISLECDWHDKGASSAGEGTCELLVGPQDAEDRAEIGRDGALECMAVGCTFDAGAMKAKCKDVTCDFGIYEGMIKAAMPDLVVGGPSEMSCDPATLHNGRARCMVDLDILPVQLVASCSTSDCVDPNMMALESGAGVRAKILAVAVVLLVVALSACCCALTYSRRRARAAAVARAAGYAPPMSYGGGKTILPDDLNAMPHISRLVFRSVNVSVLSGRRIVREATGSAKAGRVYGIIGASGSGKTTLLDAVAGVMPPGASRTGDVVLDGHPIPERGVRLPAMVGYVRQEDNLSLTLTPRECVAFAAQLTLPVTCTAEQREHAVASTLASLGLAHIADTQLGGSAAASQRVSGGERRRASIAMSMIASPRVLLLDEPTSGLDSASAHRLVATLRELAGHNRVVMLSIHQPSQRTFELLDDCMLMHQGAPVTVGSPAQLRALTDAARVPCEPGYNLADHLLDLGADVEGTARLRAASAAALAPVASLPVPDAAVAPWDAVRGGRGWRGELSQLSAELRALYWRIGISVYRHPALLRLHLVVVVILALAVGFVFHGVGNNLASFQNRSGACFFVLALFGFSGLSAMEVFIAEHELMLRELQAGYYRLSAYFVAKISVDAILLRAVPAVLFSVLFYPIMGLRSEGDRFVSFVEVSILVNVASGLLCAAISVLFESLGAANLAATILMLLLLLMNGALVNLREVGPALKAGQSLSFFRYGFEALLANELEDTIVMVDAPGIAPIPVKSRVFLAVLGMDPDNLGRDKQVLAAFCVGHAALAALLLYGRAMTWRPALPWRRSERKAAAGAPAAEPPTVHVDLSGIQGKGHEPTASGSNHTRQGPGAMFGRLGGRKQSPRNAESEGGSDATASAGKASATANANDGASVML